MILAIVAAVVVIGALVFVISKAYTPTTTALIENDTNATVTVDYCADSSVVVTPGERQEITPFVDSAHAYCKCLQWD